MSLSLFNPWVILGILVALLLSSGGSYHVGHEDGAKAVQGAWDAAEKQRAWESQKNLERVRETESNLQAKADVERKTNASLVASLNDRVSQLGNELRNRPTRPAAPAASGAQAPGPGAQNGTGLGLYREDAVFLVGEAAAGRRVQLQRDACYRAYEDAQAELAKLGLGSGSAETKP